MNFLEEIYKYDFGKLSVPFKWDEYTNEYRISLYADDYKSDLVGNGFAWSAIVITYILENIPDFIYKIRFESNNNVFIMYSNDKEALKQFTLTFKQLCDNTEVFYKLIHKVNFSFTVKAVLDFWDEHSRQLYSGTIDAKRFASLFKRRFAK